MKKNPKCKERFYPINFHSRNSFKSFKGSTGTGVSSWKMLEDACLKVWLLPGTKELGVVSHCWNISWDRCLNLWWGLLKQSTRCDDKPTYADRKMTGLEPGPFCLLNTINCHLHPSAHLPTCTCRDCSFLCVYFNTSCFVLINVNTRTRPLQRSYSPLKFHSALLLEQKQEV